ncbi:MAG: DUF4384 domain-containing protein, partial [Symploca sp. SIO1A3]|nr:DUF4384 domain-containing protein [Symploca sp. SIO1A3]
ANVTRTTNRISSTRQVPEYEVKKGSGNEHKPTYLLSQQAPPAEAVVTKVEGDLVEVWLGGIEPHFFDAFNQDAVFLLLDRTGKNLGLVQLKSRDSNNGLIGRAEVIEIKQAEALKPGLLLQEQARAIPGDLTLRIGLDESLGNASSRASIQALPSRLEPTPLGETEVHYILGRITPPRYQELQEQQTTENIPQVGSLGLYTPGLDLIPGSFGMPQETVIDAIERLQAKFRSLLAARVIKLALNANSSRLNVSAAMNILEPQTRKVLEVAATAFTVRGGDPKGVARSDRTISKVPNSSPSSTSTQAVVIKDGIATIPLGKRLQFELKNAEDYDLYLTVIVVSPEGDMILLFPNSWTADDNAALVEAGQTRFIPDPSKGDQFKITVGKPLGMVEVLIIASATPLSNALKALQSIATEPGQRGKPLLLAEESIAVIDNLLGDFDQGTRGSRPNLELLPRTPKIQFAPNVRAVNTTQLAAMSITYRAKG